MFDSERRRQQQQQQQQQQKEQPQGSVPQEKHDSERCRTLPNEECNVSDDGRPLQVDSEFQNSSSSSSNAHLVLEDQLMAMLGREGTYTASACMRQQHRRSSNILNSLEDLPIPHDEWRGKICEWCYRVIDHFQYDREVVSVGMNFFDRFLILTVAEDDGHQNNPQEGRLTCDKSPERCSCRTSSSSKVDSRTYQLAAMTALYLAIKLHAEAGADDDGAREAADAASPSVASNRITPDQRHRRYKCRKLKLMSFVELSRGQFSPKDITTMESSMLATLRWKVNPPTPMLMVAYFLRLLPSRPVTPMNDQQQIELDDTTKRHSLPQDAQAVQKRRYHGLALHVLHELARYLTELSVCLADVSVLFPPSRVAFAAILVSMDMIRFSALSQDTRNAFFDNIARVSTSHFGGFGALTPNSGGIPHLSARIQSSFLPDMLLENVMDDANGDGEHPIAIARDAGLLNLQGLRSENDRCAEENMVEDSGLLRPHQRTNSASPVTEHTVHPTSSNEKPSWSPDGDAEDSPVCVSHHVGNGTDTMRPIIESDEET